IALDLLVYVPMGDAIKISRLQLQNKSGRARTLSVTAYVEWVLGTERVAFADMAGRQTQWTADRREFLGRHGTLALPAGLQRRTAWSRRTGAGLDPCAALQTVVELEPNQSV